jgi:hypothetical protein
MLSQQEKNTTNILIARVKIVAANCDVQILLYDGSY